MREPHDHSKGGSTVIDDDLSLKERHDPDKECFDALLNVALMIRSGIVDREMLMDRRMNDRIRHSLLVLQSLVPQPLWSILFRSLNKHLCSQSQPIFPHSPHDLLQLIQLCRSLSLSFSFPFPHPLQRSDLFFFPQVNRWPTFFSPSGSLRSLNPKNIDPKHIYTLLKSPLSLLSTILSSRSSVFHPSFVDLILSLTLSPLFPTSNHPPSLSLSFPKPLSHFPLLLIPSSFLLPSPTLLSGLPTVLPDRV